jgi:hypothetical protein
MAFAVAAPVATVGVAVSMSAAVFVPTACLRCRSYRVTVAGDAMAAVTGLPDLNLFPFFDVPCALTATGAARSSGFSRGVDSGGGSASTAPPPVASHRLCRLLRLGC